MAQWLEDFKEDVGAGDLEDTREQRKAYRLGYRAAAGRAVDAANDLSKHTEWDYDDEPPKQKKHTEACKAAQYDRAMEAINGQRSVPKLECTCGDART